MKNEKNPMHPEIKTIQNICETSLHTKTTHEVCEKIKNEKKFSKSKKIKNQN